MFKSLGGPVGGIIPGVLGQNIKRDPVSPDTLSKGGGPIWAASLLFCSGAGGDFCEIYRHPDEANDIRGHVTSIYYLLGAGQVLDWHRKMRSSSGI
jgi:hypothetical protein